MMILTDNETKIDLLNNEAIAQTIIGLLRSRPDHPVTIGVHGDWGAGKSSVLEMIDSGLAQDEKVLCLKFNGWRFQGFEDAKIALIEGIVTGLIEKRPALQKAGDVVKEVFKRIDWLKVAKKAGGLAVTAFTGLPSPDLIAGLVGSLESMISDPTKFATAENLNAVVGDVKSILKPAEGRKLPEEVDGFRKAFDKLLSDAGIEQLVVLIDDLDRCLPDTAIETLEAVRLFVFTARTAFVVAADEAMIEYAVRKHFPDLPDSTGPRDYARNYLEKLIQIPFRIPALGETETRIYVTLLLAGAELGEQDPGFAKLIQIAREKLRRPWTSGGLDSSEVKVALGDHASKASNALALSDQIGPLLAKGAKGNPRQIKRFLNALLLRELTATARGFKGDIQLPALAKLMLAERFLPALFDQIASVAAVDQAGKYESLKSFEDELATEEKKRSTDSEVDQKPAETDNPALAEWRLSDDVRAWARLSPRLGDLDLRPYLFVAKDRKDYFGPMSALGHLAPLIDKLVGSKLALQSIDGDLKKLQASEAEKVFEAVRSKMLTAGSLETRPAGADGLAALVKAQPSLQNRLLDFLDSLPKSKVGPWVVGGWHMALRDAEHVERFGRIVGDWGKVSDNPALKAAASTTQKAKKGSA
jgi:predicted KAP-like P-loop ATPase